MLGPKERLQYYQALIDKNSDFEGVFFVGVTTTGVFCRPTCPARKPKKENCVFFQNAQEALISGFRPCLRCRPLISPHHASKLIQRLVDAIEKHPEKRWKNSDFQRLSIHAATARRQFKKRFGMTFIAYARARRMGLALKHVRTGDSIIEAQLVTGYESSSGFRDAFSRIMGTAPTQLKERPILKASWIDTPLGPMIAIADENALYLLEFVDRRGLELEIEKLRKKGYTIIPGSTPPLVLIKQELSQYFNGHLRIFTTPLFYLGSAFQQRVWEELQRIPYAQTRSYSDMAMAMGMPTARRAVARANGSNQLALIIPCHRVINANGELGGYAGGISRKQWLLQHERKMR